MSLLSLNACVLAIYLQHPASGNNTRLLWRRKSNITTLDGSRQSRVHYISRKYQWSAGNHTANASLFFSSCFMSTYNPFGYGRPTALILCGILISEKWAEESDLDEDILLAWYQPHQILPDELALQL